MNECIRCYEFTDAAYEICASCSFETAPANCFGVRVGRQWVVSWDSERRVGAMGPASAAHRWTDFKAAMNAAHYLGDRAVAMNARSVRTLFEVEERLF